MFFDGDYDYMYGNESDEDENCLSSDDEGVFQDVSTGRLLLKTKKTIAEKDEDEEDFEQLMNRELDERISKLDCVSNKNTKKSLKKVKFEDGETSAEAKPEQYNSIYFDSDDDDEIDSQKKDHKVMSNDDLFYDPESDSEDQKWIDKHRSRYLSTQKIKKQVSQVKPLPKSDAVLNCPGCMTMLCLDCQRHELYHSQFRAMFVFNCDVNREESINYPIKSKKKRKNIQGKDEFYNPVKCSICSTEVAVYDKDEVYHFFNIIASHS